jgi:hypothetical protein
MSETNVVEKYEDSNIYYIGFKEVLPCLKLT